MAPSRTMNSPQPTGIALIAPPWSLYSRPSIQIGALKAFVRSRFPSLPAAAHHLHLMVAEAVGFRRYHAVSERTWLAESVFAALLYPERAETIGRFFRRQAKGSRILGPGDFEEILQRADLAVEGWLASTDWTRVRLAGITSALCQFSSGLHIARRIKDRSPRTTVVLGGPAFSTASAPAALALFPEIDAVVIGEGELPLAHLVHHHVREGLKLEELPPLPALLSRFVQPPLAADPVFHQLENLDHLPHPDYDEYMQLLAGFEPAKRFFPTLPVELSRGCWWQEEVGGCAFCNLNQQWRGYRSKSGPRAAAEFDHLTRRHKTLGVALMDNVLPREGVGATFRAVADLGKDLNLFAEIRATASFAELKALHAAGLRRVQIGIEALSTRLLRKLRKGASAIQNLEAMKHCERLGIVNLANLITGFPASDEQDVRETLRNLEFALPFHPLSGVEFWVGLGSPVWRRPAAFGLRSVSNHPHWGKLFPAAVVRAFPFAVQSASGQTGRQRRLWQPVRAALRAWSARYTQLHRGPFQEPILGYRDGGEFLIIRERRPGGESATHRLEGVSRKIYLFCETHQPLPRIADRFPEIPADRIEVFLRQLTAQKVVFEENGRFLSLAVPEHPNPAGGSVFPSEVSSP